MTESAGWVFVLSQSSAYREQTHTPTKDNKSSCQQSHSKLVLHVRCFPHKFVVVRTKRCREVMSQCIANMPNLVLSAVALMLFTTTGWAQTRGNSVVFAVVWCLSVCPSHAGIVSKWLDSS